MPAQKLPRARVVLTDDIAEKIKICQKYYSAKFRIELDADSVLVVALGYRVFMIHQEITSNEIGPLDRSAYCREPAKEAFNDAIRFDEGVNPEE